MVEFTHMIESQISITGLSIRKARRFGNFLNFMDMQLNKEQTNGLAKKAS